MSASPERPPRGAGPEAALLLTDYGRAVGEFGSLFYSWPLLAAVPRRDGRPALVLPGLTHDDRLTLLRTYLARLGYQVYGWDRAATSGRPRKQ